eukprot:SM000026S08992  [mRNA]  locus=s26:1003027:1021649:+ [translate_table: standard]
MNVLRTVSGFWKKGQGLEEASAIPAVGLPSWPEVEFRFPVGSDSPEEELLSALWQGYEVEQDTVKKQLALNAFLLSFIRTFDNRRPELDSEVSSQEDSGNLIKIGQGRYASKSGQFGGRLVGCQRGHPTRIVVEFVKELGSAETALFGASRECPWSFNHKDSEIALNLLHALTIATRYYHNRRIFSFFEGFQYLMCLMRGSAIQLAKEVTESTCTSTTHLSLLECLLAHIVSVIANFVNAEVRLLKVSSSRSNIWQISYSGDEGSIQSDGSTDEMTKERVNADKLLLEKGGLKWCLELVRCLELLRSRKPLGDNSLEKLTLRVLRSALIAYPWIQSYFRSVGGIALLTEGLGKPHVEAGHQEMVDHLFKMQILHLKVIREALYNNTVSFQQFVELGGTAKLVEMLRWAALHVTAADSDSTGTKPLQAPCSQASIDVIDPRHGTQWGLSHAALETSHDPATLLDPLYMTAGLKNVSSAERNSPSAAFAVLQNSNTQLAELSLLYQSFLPAHQVTNPPGNVEQALAAGSYQELAIAQVCHIYLDVFREGSEQSELECAALSFFRTLLDAFPVITVNCLRLKSAWPLLFSPTFFYHGALRAVSLTRITDATSRSSASLSLVNRALLVASSPRGGKASEEDITYMPRSSHAEVLREEVLVVLKIAATTPLSTLDNEEIIMLSPDTSLTAMLSVEAPLILTAVMSRQQQQQEQMKAEHGSACAKWPADLGGDVLEMDNQARDTRIRAEVWAARRAVSDLFGDYLAISEVAARDTVQNWKAVNVLFDLIWEPSVRSWAIQHIILLMKVPMMTSEDRDAKTSVVVKYLEALPRGQSSAIDAGPGLLLDLLAGLRELVQEDPKLFQEILLECECFVQLASVLNGSYLEAEGRQLGLDVLQTITHILAGNEACKAALRALLGPGYTTLLRLLLDLFQSKPDTRLLEALFDMLVDGGFSASGSRLIKNEDVINLIFHVLMESDRSLQVKGVADFCTLLKESTANKASCVRADLLTLLLHWFFHETDPDLWHHLASLVQLIGSYSLNGKDMRFIFNLLKTDAHGHRPKHGAVLLGTLQEMLKGEGPAVFFECNGLDSGIEVKSPIKWPNNHGYSFTCWLRIEAYPSVTQEQIQPLSSSASMGLFLFQSEEKKGCTVLIGGHGLFVHSSSSSKIQCCTLPFNFELKTWYFVSCTHSMGRAMTSSSTFKLYVGGKFVASEKLCYPKGHELMAMCSIGSATSLNVQQEGSARSSQIIKAVLDPHFQPFCGQIGPIYIYEDVLSATQIAGIHSLGADYMYSFLDSETGYVPDDILIKGVLMDVKDGLSTCVLASYNAQASRGRTVLDSSLPLANRAPHDASLLPGSQLCYRKRLQDVIHCVGGIGVVFPLLTQLPQPLSFNFVNPPSEISHAETHSTSAAADAVDLLRAVLEGNYANQQAMVNIAGISIMGFLLQRLSPEQLTQEVLECLKQLLGTLARASASWLRELLVVEFLSKIFLEARIWLSSSFHVHYGALSTAGTVAADNASYLHGVCRLSRLLDMLRLYYSNEPEVAHAHKAAIEVTSTQGRLQLQKLRMLLLRFQEHTYQNGVSLIDVQALVAYMEMTKDAVSLEDVLRCQLALFRSSPVYVESMAMQMSNLGGCAVLLCLLNREQESVRLLGLRLIGALLLLPPDGKQPCLPGSSSEILSIIFSTIAGLLQKYEVTEATLTCLLEIAVGGLGLKQAIGRDIGGTADVGGALTDVTTMRLPQILMAALPLVYKCKPTYLGCKFFSRVLYLLQHSRSNLQAFLFEVPNWQEWLLRRCSTIFAGAAAAMDERYDGCKIDDEQELAVIRKIFAAAHTFAICFTKGGWLHVDRTYKLLQAMANLSAHTVYGVSNAQKQEADQVPKTTLNRSQSEAASIAKLFAHLDKEVLRVLRPGDALEQAQAQHLGKDSIRPEDSLADKGPHWRLYEMVWALLGSIYGKKVGGGKVAHLQLVPTLAQRARSLLDSLNGPASEIAGAFNTGQPGGLSRGLERDKVMKLRGDRCPRVAFRLALLYLHHADLASASRAAEQLSVLLPDLLAVDTDVVRSRLQLFLCYYTAILSRNGEYPSAVCLALHENGVWWFLVDARMKVGSMDGGARLHLVSELINETVKKGRSLLVHGAGFKQGEVSVQSLISQKLVQAAVKEEDKYVRNVIEQQHREADELKEDLTRRENLDLAQNTLLYQQVQNSLSSICAAEMDRQSAARLALDEEQQAVARHWRQVLRTLTSERGVWSPDLPAGGTFQKHHWKLDKAEDPQRRRMRLRQNYNFDENLTFAAQEKEDRSPSQPDLQSQADALSEAEKSAVLPEALSEHILRGPKKVGGGQDGLGDDDADFRGASEIDSSAALVVKANAAVAASSGELPQSETRDERQGNQVQPAQACVLVSTKRKLAGTLELVKSHLHFHADFLVEGSGGSSLFDSHGDLAAPSTSLIPLSNMSMEEKEKPNAFISGSPTQLYSMDIKQHRRWLLCQVRDVHIKRFLLRFTAIEIFFSTGATPPILFNFPSAQAAKAMAFKIASSANSLPSTRYPHLAKGADKYREKAAQGVLVFDRRKMVETAEVERDRWRRREISNFEYLMILNTLSGRSYNDLMQYPIFPWIIADYQSDSLDLSIPSTYRDLSKPVGALDEKRFKIFEDRFQTFNDPDIPGFFYGSHYSTAGIVLYYLIRLEPFTSLNRHLQGNKFDHADRLFDEVASAYSNCMTNTSDVKELIPEFYYQPEFLRNSNKYQLGQKQDGKQLDDVALPPWAKGSPEEFVRLSREALESEYISDRLHHWIDLIFGSKQRGGAAVEAANVFYYLTYEGAVDLESLEDPLERAAVEDQIANFGQTPMQLFRKDHPPRGPLVPILRPLYYAPASITLTSIVTPTQAQLEQASRRPAEEVKSIVFVGLLEGRSVALTAGGVMIVRSWITPQLQSSGGPFTFSASQEAYYGVGDALMTCRVGGSFVSGVEPNPTCFGILFGTVTNSAYVLSCGHWDNSFKCHSISDGKLAQSIGQHKDLVTCLSVASDARFVVTGSRDTTVIVWEANTGAPLGVRPIVDKPMRVLTGHADAVTAVTACAELDLVASGSRDATCAVHTLRHGRYLFALRHPSGSPVDHLVISPCGIIAMYSHDDLVLRCCTLQGRWLAQSESFGRLACLRLSACGEFLVTGGELGQVVVWRLHSLQVVRRYEGRGVPITSLTVTPEDCFLVGLQDGTMLVFAVEAQQLKQAAVYFQLPKG